jgi:hypothetical protein
MMPESAQHIDKVLIGGSKQAVNNLLLVLEGHHERQMVKLIELREGIRQLSRVQQISAWIHLQKSCPNFITTKKRMTQGIMTQLDDDNGPIF